MATIKKYVKINQFDFEALLTCSIGYALGEPAYTTSWIDDTITKHINDISPVMLSIITEGLQKKLEQCERKNEMLSLDSCHQKKIALLKRLLRALNELELTA